MLKILWNLGKDMELESKFSEVTLYKVDRNKLYFNAFESPSHKMEKYKIPKSKFE
jgi:hypothetical protein